MAGGAGDDVYNVDDAGDQVVEAPGAGFDVVHTTLNSYALTDNVEWVSFTGAGNFSGTGNDGDNWLVGGSGNDTLDGGLGADTMVGGLGDDLFYVDSVADYVIEATGGGTDTVRTTLGHYVVQGGVENATYIGASTGTLIGNALDNLLTGGAGNDLLVGGVGADTLIGLGGDDTMVGGTGNDLYVVDSLADYAAEAAGEGTDAVQTVLTNYTLQANIENLTYTGGGNATLFGNGLANVITGGAGADYLNGGAGVDTLIGLGGDDRYIVDNAADVVTEDVGGGNDTVYASSGAYTLSANVEWLVNDNVQLPYYGSPLTNFHGVGNALDNVIIGNSGNDTLEGGDGNDTLVGGGGNAYGGYPVDFLDGGNGDDQLLIRSESLILGGASGGAGTDFMVITDVAGSVGTWLNVSGMEVLWFSGTGAQSAVLDNDAAAAFGGFISVYAPVASSLSIDASTMTLGQLSAFGTANADSIRGGTMADNITGGGGADSLFGGDGDDAFNFSQAQLASAGLHLDGGNGFDRIWLTGDVSGATDASFAGVSNIEELRFTGFGTQSMSFGNAAAAAFTGPVSVQATNASSVNFDASAMTTGQLYAWGTLGADTISGGSGADRFVSNGGADWFTGGAGNDTFVFAPGELAAAAHVDGGTGLDTLLLKGNSLNLTDAAFAASSGMEFLLLVGTGTHSLTLGANAGAAFGSTLTIIQGAASTLNLDASAVGSGTGVSASSSSGADTMIGGAGNDTFAGGGGADLFGVGIGQDVIADFTSGSDHVALQTGGFVTFADLFAASSQVGLNTQFNLGGGNTLTLLNIDRTTLSGSSFGLP
jgi:Ca2+-binding RTX toxin-like protein